MESTVTDVDVALNVSLIIGINNADLCLEASYFNLLILPCILYTV